MKKSLVILGSLFLVMTAYAQQKNQAYLDYIEKYGSIYKSKRKENFEKFLYRLSFKDFRRFRLHNDKSLRRSGILLRSSFRYYLLY